MGFLRFSRRIRILPAVRLNLSRSGGSASIGRRGLWYTAGNGRRRTTVGLPGSGISYTSVHSQHAERPADASQGRQPSAARCFAWMLPMLGIVVLIVWAVVR